MIKFISWVSDYKITISTWGSKGSISLDTIFCKPITDIDTAKIGAMDRRRQQRTDRWWQLGMKPAVRGRELGWCYGSAWEWVRRRPYECVSCEIESEWQSALVHGLEWLREWLRDWACSCVRHELKWEVCGLGFTILYIYIYISPRKYLTGENPKYEPLLYCRF